jgi:hypothetical protein
MSPVRKQKGQSLHVFIFVLIILFSIGLVFCSNAKKAESPAENSSHKAPSEGVSLPESREIAEQAAGKQAKTSPADIDLTVKRLENAFSALEDAIQRIPRETFDPEAIIQKAGGDALKLFEWVRDETDLIAYQGCLRGSVGVLMDRRGNSLDRALLLCELLRRAGYEARLARRHLSDEETALVLKKLERRPRKQASPLLQSTFRNQEDLLDFYVQNFELDRKNLVETISKSQREQENKIRQIQAEHKELTADIFTILNTSMKSKLQDQDNTVPDDLKDHWWVQLERDGDWVDLDPVLPDAAPGQTLGTPEETLKPDDLDEEIFHAIRIKVIAEQFEEGDLKEKLVLQHTLVPLKTLGERIVLRHFPLVWPSDEKFLKTQEPVPFLKEALAKQTEWQAVLEIDEEIVEKSFVTAQGSISDEPSQKAGRKEGRPGSPGGLLKGLVREEEEEQEKTEKPSDKAHLTAEWLEFEVHTPGRPVQIHRREIFDLIGPQARKEKSIRRWKPTERQRLDRALQILGETEILPLFCRLSPEFIEEWTASYVLLNRRVYLNLVEDYGRWEPEELLLEMTKIKPLYANLYGLALKRFKLSPYGDKISVCSPNLLARRSRLTENGRGELIGIESLDIIANDISLTQKTSESAFSARVEQGILDTLVEAYELEGRGIVENTALLFRQSRTEGMDWLLLQGLEDPNWKRIRVSGDVRSRLEQDLSRGFDVIVPAKEIMAAGKPRFTWWRLNPETGNLLGIGEKGSGQALSEYAEEANFVIQLKTAFEFYGQFTRCLGAALSSPLRGGPPQHDYFVIQCLWEMICKYAEDLAGELLDIDVNWINIIIDRTIDWALDDLCDALWEEIDK